MLLGELCSELFQTGTVKSLMRARKWQLRKVYALGSVVDVDENDI